MPKQTFNYFAFISYKREDEKWAKWLQRRLEYYKVPLSVRKNNSSIPEKTRPVFLDKSDLSGGVLEQQINNALESSRYLIVICSPRSARSKWVGKEAQKFIDDGREKSIIPFIVEGTPGSNDEKECLPDALLKLKGARELLGININDNGREAAAVKIIAQMLGLRFDILWQRFRRHQRRRTTAIITLLIAIIIAVLIITAYIFNQNKEIERQCNLSENRRIEAENAREIAEYQRNRADKASDSIRLAYQDLEKSQIALKESNAALALANSALLTEQVKVQAENWAMQQERGRVLSAEAIRLAESGEIYKAQNLMYSIVPFNLINQKKPFVPEMEIALRRIHRLKLRPDFYQLSSLQIPFTSTLKFSSDDKFIYYLDDNNILKYDYRTETVIDTIYSYMSTDKNYSIREFDISRNEVYIENDSLETYYSLNYITNCINQLSEEEFNLRQSFINKYNYADGRITFRHREYSCYKGPEYYNIYKNDSIISLIPISSNEELDISICSTNENNTYVVLISYNPEKNTSAFRFNSLTQNSPRIPSFEIEGRIYPLNWIKNTKTLICFSYHPQKTIFIDCESQTVVNSLEGNALYPTTSNNGLLTVVYDFNKEIFRLLSTDDDARKNSNLLFDGLNCCEDIFYTKSHVNDSLTTLSISTIDNIYQQRLSFNKEGRKKWGHDSTTFYNKAFIYDKSRIINEFNLFNLLNPRIKFIGKYLYLKNRDITNSNQNNLYFINYATADIRTFNTTTLYNYSIIDRFNSQKEEYVYFNDKDNLIIKFDIKENGVTSYPFKMGWVRAFSNNEDIVWFLNENYLFKYNFTINKVLNKKECKHTNFLISDDDSLITLINYNSIEILDARSLDKITEIIISNLVGDPTSRSFHFSPDNKYFMIHQAGNYLMDSGIIYIYDIASGLCVDIIDDTAISSRDLWKCVHPNWEDSTFSKICDCLILTRAGFSEFISFPKLESLIEKLFEEKEN